VRNKDKFLVGKSLIFLSVIATVLAFIGSLGVDLWLASTQWMLVGITLAMWGVFVLIEAQFKIR